MALLRRTPLASLVSVLGYTAVPFAAAVAGGALAAFVRFGPRVTSAVQHFAAGVVFAAAAGELLPDVLHTRSLAPVIIGAVGGVAVMLLLKWFGKRRKGPTGFLTAAGIDILVDGLVLGIGFAAGPREGLLLTIALTIEVLFLGLSVAEPLHKAAATAGRIIATTIVLALMLPVGAVVGVLLGASPEPIQSGLFSFGLIALLYLVTEELLVEAHETPDNPTITATFFIGFLLLIIIEQQMR